ncbi:MAG: hypothetical protein WC261_10500 [Synergistaceae bacterium]|jgi:hypothetical protein
MEIASLEHHHMTECGNCGELIIFTGRAGEAINGIDALMKTHLDLHPSCKKWYDALPTFTEIQVLAKEEGWFEKES